MLYKELVTGACEFDRTIAGLRLRPICLFDRKCNRTEKHFHSSIGEWATGRWAMNKCRPNLWGRQFTWITDCTGISSFMEMDLLPQHQAQRWKLDMLCFDFTIVHRPERMLFECNLLSRYNSWTL
jgi:hypothetical protein